MWFPDAANKKSEQKIRAKRTLLWLAEMEGFEPPRRFSTPTSRFSRPFPSTAWVHLQMYSRSNVSRKKERNLERNPDFLLISCRRNPLKTQGKLKNGFQNTLPFSRPPRYVRFGNAPWRAERLYAQKSYHKSPVLSIEKRRCTTIFGRKGLHKGHFMI